MARKINYDNWSKEELIKELRRIKETKYGLVWHRDLPEEKIDILINPDARTPNEMFPNEIAGKPFPVLKEIKSKEINGDKDKPINLLIEGDNYHSLAVLNFTHHEAIDLIYIDPPYNTGNNDFIYNDLQARSVQRDDPFRHSKWLSFMEKRLKLAHRLLKNTGVIFISIDDNELAQLKLLMDEVFGEDNFISILSVENNPKGRKNSDHISISNDYCLIYAKSRFNSYFNEVIPKDEKDMIEDDDGNYIHNSGKRVLVGENKFNKKVINFNSSKHYSVYYNIELNDLIIKKEYKLNEIDNKLLDKGYKRYISYLGNDFIENTYTSDKLRDLFDEDRLDIKGEKIYEKNFSSEIRLKSILTNRKYKAIINNLSVEYEIDLKTTSAQQGLREMFGKDVFNFPKNVSFLKLLIKLHPNKNATILDFMAGSGTTGQATMELNKEEGGNRQFILCTNNEELNNNGEKIKHKICTDVCYPRLKKVIKGYKDIKGDTIDGSGSNLKYYTCDFVEAEPTDRNKRKLVNESTEMLCIKENAFELVEDKGDFKIYKNSDKYLGIIFYEEAIDDFKKAIKKIKGHFNVYVFSLGDDPHEKQFTDVRSRVTLCAIPEVILKVYREIFK